MKTNQAIFFLTALYLLANDNAAANVSGSAYFNSNKAPSVAASNKVDSKEIDPALKDFIKTIGKFSARNSPSKDANFRPEWIESVLKVELEERASSSARVVKKYVAKKTEIADLRFKDEAATVIVRTMRYDSNALSAVYSVYIDTAKYCANVEDYSRLLGVKFLRLILAPTQKEVSPSSKDNERPTESPAPEKSDTYTAVGTYNLTLSALANGCVNNTTSISSHQE